MCYYINGKFFYLVWVILNIKFFEKVIVVFIMLMGILVLMIYIYFLEDSNFDKFVLLEICRVRFDWLLGMGFNIFIWIMLLEFVINCNMIFEKVLKFCFFGVFNMVEVSVVFVSFFFVFMVGVKEACVVLGFWKSGFFMIKDWLFIGYLEFVFCL